MVRKVNDLFMFLRNIMYDDDDDESNHSGWIHDS